MAGSLLQRIAARLRRLWPRRAPPAPADARRAATAHPPPAQHVPAPGAGAALEGLHALGGASCHWRLVPPPVPPGHGGGAAAPLVVMLHGCRQSIDDFAAGTAMHVAAGRAGLWVLYAGQPARAHPHRCWNWYEPAHQSRRGGEPALLADLVRTVVAAHPIDADRVYVAGLSAGGAMAAILGTHWPDVFAAIGVHSGLPAGAATGAVAALAVMRRGPQPHDEHPPSVPAIVFHGDADPVVHPAHGDAVAAAAAGALADVETQALRRGGRSCLRRRYVAPDGRVRAEHWRVVGAAHAWQGGSTAGSFTDASGPDASAEMLRFFAQWQRGAPTTGGAGPWPGPAPQPSLSG